MVRIFGEVAEREQMGNFFGRKRIARFHRRLARHCGHQQMEQLLLRRRPFFGHQFIDDRKENISRRLAAEQ